MAELLGVKPWEVADIPIYWVTAALTRASAEARAQRDIARRQRAAERLKQRR